MSDSNPSIAEAARVLRDARCIVVLTGAGISVESGIPDFRSEGGLWERFPPEDYATVEALHRDPDRVWEFFRELGRGLAAPEPNPAHRALARLERDGRIDAIVTQNIDGLHHRAGSKRIVEVHGSHRELRCERCARREPFVAAYLEPGPAPTCDGCGGLLRPDVVLFGESVEAMDDAAELVEACDCLWVIGTSALVYPVAGLPALASTRGSTVIDCNIESSGIPGAVEVRGAAGSTVPRLAAAVAGNRPEIA